MKKLLFIVFLQLWAVSAALAQELKPRFSLSQSDLTAQSQPRNDLNGRKCALVKIEFVGEISSVDGNVVGDVVRHTNETWAYMPQNSRQLKVITKNFLPLMVTFADHGIERLESGMTYVLTLAKPGATATEQQTQTLTIRYAPTSAMVLVDNKLIKGSNGIAQTTLPIGQHSFVVACDGYESEEGTVKLKASAPSNLQITLSKENQPAQQTSAPVQASNTSSSGNTITIPIKDGVSIEMVKVEAGSFMMGATPEMKNPWGDEKPAHRVTLTNDYYLSKYEVTQAQWQAVMGSNPSHIKGNNLPVDMVSWDECQVFISKLNSLTGRKFRLPTEAEWEFAARGGNKSKGYQFSGSNIINDVAWFFDINNLGSHPVGIKLPNELGFYDMSGNVSEWCQDWDGSYSSDSQTNPTGPTNGVSRIVRGGSWLENARDLRLSYRRFHKPDFCNDIGLRLCLSE